MKTVVKQPNWNKTNLKHNLTFSWIVKNAIKRTSGAILNTFKCLKIFNVQLKKGTSTLWKRKRILRIPKNKWTSNRYGHWKQKRSKIDFIVQRIDFSHLINVSGSVLSTVCDANMKLVGPEYCVRICEGISLHDLCFNEKSDSVLLDTFITTKYSNNSFVRNNTYQNLITIIILNLKQRRSNQMLVDK